MSPLRVTSRGTALAPTGVNGAIFRVGPPGALKDRIQTLNRERPHFRAAHRQGSLPVQRYRAGTARQRHRHGMLSPCSAASRVPALTRGGYTALDPACERCFWQLSMASEGCRPGTFNHFSDGAVTNATLTCRSCGSANIAWTLGHPALGERSQFGARSPFPRHSSHEYFALRQTATFDCRRLSILVLRLQLNAEAVRLGRLQWPFRPEPPAAVPDAVAADGQDRRPGRF